MAESLYNKNICNNITKSINKTFEVRLKCLDQVKD